MSALAYWSHSLHVELKDIIRSKNSKNLIKFLDQHVYNTYSLIVCGDSWNADKYENILQSIIESFEPSDVEIVMTYILKSILLRHLHCVKAYTPLCCIIKSNITPSNELQLVTSLFKIYQNHYKIFGPSLIHDLIAHADLTLIKNILTSIKHKKGLYVLENTDHLDAYNNKLTALLIRDDLTTLLNHPTILNLIFLEFQEKCAIIIPNLVQLLLSQQNYSLTNRSLLYKKFLEIYQKKMKSPSTYQYVGVDLILNNIVTFGMIANDNMITNINFLINQIDENDYPNYIKPMNIQPNSPEHQHTNTTLMRCAKRNSPHELKMCKFLIQIYKIFDLPLDERIPPFLQKSDELIKIIMWCIKIGYFNPLIYKQLSTQHIKQLQTMQSHQLANITQHLNTYLTEKGLYKIISNYVGIDENLIYTYKHTPNL